MIMRNKKGEGAQWDRKKIRSPHTDLTKFCQPSEEQWNITYWVQKAGF